MNCLLVGAGAVGQVYGRHLHQGGAAVAFLVKDRHEPEARAGFPLYPLNERGARKQPVRFRDYDVFTSVEQVAARRFDVVFLCTSSTALRAGSWFAALAPALADATVVMLTVGLEDHAFVTGFVAPERVVTGLIGLMSYAAPLDGESVPEPGTAYWFPPAMKCPFSGAPPRARPIVELMRRGGFPAALRKDVGLEAAFGSALLQTSIFALECAGWSIRALRQDKDLLHTAHRAMREACAAAAAVREARVPLLHRSLRPWHLGLLLRTTAMFAPLDVERFFQFHYTKVRDQSMDMLATWMRAAAEHGLPADGLRDLQARLDELAAA